MGLLYVCVLEVLLPLIVFFKQKAAYEMRISDWSSDVCSSDLVVVQIACVSPRVNSAEPWVRGRKRTIASIGRICLVLRPSMRWPSLRIAPRTISASSFLTSLIATIWRSEEHTSELQSLMRISYAVFCLKKKIDHVKGQRRQTVTT